MEILTNFALNRVKMLKFAFLSNFKGISLFYPKVLSNAILGAFLTLSMSCCFAEEEGIGRWGGLNDSAEAVIIPSHQSQDCLNVEISKTGSSLKQREGCNLTHQLTYSTSSVTSYTFFKNSSGDDIRLVAYDISIQKSVNNASYVYFTTTTRGAIWDFEPNGGYIYAINSVNDVVWKYDGTTKTYLGEAPQGTQTEFTQERMVITGVSGYPNTLYFSAANNYTEWTIDVEETSPWSEEVGLGGEEITAIKWGLGRLFVFKRNSITICFIDNQFNSECSVKNNGLGVKKRDFKSILQHLNFIYFKANDDHFYRTDGSIFEKISEPIPTFLSNLVKGEDKINIQTTQTDFDAGTITNNGSIPSLLTTLTIGSIEGSTWTATDTSGADFGAGTLTNCATTYINGSITMLKYLDDFEDGNMSVNPVWYSTGISVSGGVASGVGQSDTNTETLTSDFLGVNLRVKITNASDLSNIKYKFLSNSRALTDTGSMSGYYVIIQRPNIFRLYRVDATSINQLNSTNIVFDDSNYHEFGVRVVDSASNITFYLSYDGVLSTAPVDTSYIIMSGTYNVFGINTVNVYLDDIEIMNDNNMSFTSQIFNTTFSTPTGGPFDVTDTKPAGTQIDYFVRESTATGGTWSSWSATSDTLRVPMSKQYQQYKADFYTSYSTQTPQIDDVTLVTASTGIFTSQCIQPDTDITVWSNFTGVMTTLGTGTGVFYSRSSDTCSNLTNVSWTAQTNNAVVSVSTDIAYQFQWINSVGSSTDIARLDSVVIGWAKGNVPAYGYGVYHDDAIYWAINYSSGTINNRTLKYDLKFREWFPFDIAMNNPLDIDNSFYFTDASTGKLYKYGDVNSDNNVAINSYWKSKDFTGISPFKEKTYTLLSIIGKNQTSGTLELEYKTNASTSTTYNYTIYLSSVTGNLLRYNHKMPIGVFGTSFNIKFSNNAQEEPWEIYSVFWEYLPKSWRVLP